MRTRNASIIETISVWSFIFITLFFGSTYYFTQKRKFTKEQEKLQKNQNIIREKLDALQREIDGFDRQIPNLEKQLQKKKEIVQKQWVEYKKKEDLFKKNIQFFIPKRLKADLTEKILKIASDYNVQVLSLKNNKEKKISDKTVKDIFVEYHFEISFAGIYENIKKYLWRLSHLIIIKDENDIPYRAIVKIKWGGLKIIDLSKKAVNDKEEKMRLELKMITFFKIKDIIE